MNKIVGLILTFCATTSFADVPKNSDIPLWKRCYELVELHRNAGGLFTTSLREAAYAGSCSGTLKTIAAMSRYTTLSCAVPVTAEAAEMLVAARVVSTHEAVEIFCW